MKPVPPVTSTFPGGCPANGLATGARRAIRQAAIPSRIPDTVTPTAKRLSTQPRQPRSSACSAVGSCAHAASCIAIIPNSAPPLTASSVCSTRSVAGSLRLWSSTTKSHNVSTTSTTTTAAMAATHAPWKATFAIDANTRP